MKPRKATHSKKNKFVIGLVSLSMMTVLTLNVSFADEDLQVKLQHWYETKSQNAMEIIDQAVKSEVEIQKERLRKEVQLKMAQSAEELDDFTEEQKEQRVNAVRSYTDQLISGMKFSNEAEKAALREQLISIQENAIRQMDQVADGFEPAPAEQQQTEPVEKNPDGHVPEQENANANEGTEVLPPEATDESQPSDGGGLNDGSANATGEEKNESGGAAEVSNKPAENPSPSQDEKASDSE